MASKPDTKDWWSLAFIVVGLVWTAFELIRGQWGWAVLGSAMVAFSVLEIKNDNAQS